jgi:hypothetical protein
MWDQIVPLIGSNLCYVGALALVLLWRGVARRRTRRALEITGSAKLTGSALAAAAIATLLLYALAIVGVSRASAVAGPWTVLLISGGLFALVTIVVSILAMRPLFQTPGELTSREFQTAAKANIQAMFSKAPPPVSLLFELLQASIVASVIVLIF